MQAEITPEPTDEEREALLRALAALNGDQPVSAWWVEGVLEAVEPDSL